MSATTQKYDIRREMTLKYIMAEVEHGSERLPPSIATGRCLKLSSTTLTLIIIISTFWER
ncbi:hypothetical protein QCA50_004886 [Cerrena zonata]|uniref:Uncharacterized protein n=1 Tax=Cerrena zonata TaxID=2478898 RepID=A0AAW0GI60_9APHY